MLLLMPSSDTLLLNVMVFSLFGIRFSGNNMTRLALASAACSPSSRTPCGIYCLVSQCPSSLSLLSF